MILISALEYEDDDSWFFKRSFTATSEAEFVEYLKRVKPAYMIADMDTFTQFKDSTTKEMLMITEIKYFEED